MFVFNGAIFVAGAAVLGLGIWFKVDSGSILGILESVDNAPDGLSELVNVSYMLIGVGAVLLVIGFLGCCGAVKESRCMLLTFFSVVLIIFIIEVVGAVMLLVFKDVGDELLQKLEKEVIQSIKNNYGEDEGFTSLWNATMEEFQCCGYMNYTDFDNSPFNNDHNIYPRTCCNTTFVCDMGVAETSKVIGCYNKLMELIEENAVIIAAVALGIVALEIAAMVVSMVLYKDIGRKR